MSVMHAPLPDMPYAPAEARRGVGARARAHVVSKQVLIGLATNFLNGTCQDASRICSSMDSDLPEGLRGQYGLKLPCASLSPALHRI